MVSLFPNSLTFVELSVRILGDLGASMTLCSENESLFSKDSSE